MTTDWPCILTAKGEPASNLLATLGGRVSNWPLIEGCCEAGTATLAGAGTGALVRVGGCTGLAAEVVFKAGRGTIPPCRRGGGVIPNCLTCKIFITFYYFFNLSQFNVNFFNQQS